MNESGVTRTIPRSYKFVEGIKGPFLSFPLIANAALSKIVRLSCCYAVIRRLTRTKVSYDFTIMVSTGHSIPWRKEKLFGLTGPPVRVTVQTLLLDQHFVSVNILYHST